MVFVLAFHEIFTSSQCKESNVKVIKIYLGLSRSQESQSSVANLSSGIPTLKISLSPKWLKNCTPGSKKKKVKIPCINVK